MNKESFKTIEDFLYFALKENHSATQFCLLFLQALNVWDDLIDKDNDVKDSHINDAFTICLVHIPKNRFYIAYQNELTPMIHNVILQWHNANELEKIENSNNDKHKAWMLRAGVYQLFHYCTMLTGGEDWAKNIGPEVWRLYGETVEQHLEEFS